MGGGGYRCAVSSSRRLPTAAPLPVGLRPPTARSRSARAAADRSRKRWRVPSWAEQAACAGQTDLFFGSPTEPERERIDRERLALAVCAACPVVAPCRDHARQFRESGIWGGENEKDRRAALKLAPTAATPKGGAEGTDVFRAPIAATGTESAVPTTRHQLGD